MEQQYKTLEQKFLQYSDLKNVKVTENGEKFVEIPELKNLGAKYFKDDMKQYFDGKIIVREQVGEKLKNIAEFLKNNFSNLKLIVTYGYRILEIQTKYFNNRLKKVIEENPGITDREELIEIAHRGAAFPEVAGHPTGGAVDITIFNLEKQEFLDFGTEVGDYSTKKCYLNSPEINKEQKENRNFLQKIMTKEGFSPYLGEWWHFSFGDIENTVFYDKQEAIYKSMGIDEIIINN